MAPAAPPAATCSSGDEPLPLIPAAQLLAWRRRLLAARVAQASQAAALDWLLELGGGLSWRQRQELWLHPQRPVRLSRPLAELESLWQRHQQTQEPLQYLVGLCPWRDLRLAVAPGVLIPRQETELLVDLALRLIPAAEAGQPLRWVDLGTGSGCLALALLRALPGSEGLAVDASREALRQAAANLADLAASTAVAPSPGAITAGSLPPGPLPVELPSEPLAAGELAAERQTAEPAPRRGFAGQPHSGQPLPAQALSTLPPPPPALPPPVLAAAPRLQIRQGDWWEPVRDRWGRLQLAVSNPPYIPSAALRRLDPVVRDHEPWLALDGGEDGLEAIRRIIAGAPDALAPGGVLLLEHHHDQSEAVLALLTAAGLEAACAHRDLEGVARFVSARRPERP